MIGEQVLDLYASPLRRTLDTRADPLEVSVDIGIDQRSPFRINESRMLVAEPIVMSELTVGYGEVVLSLFADLGMHPNILAVADNIETMKTVIRQGRGCAIMPAAAAAEEAAQGVLRVLAFEPARKVALALCRRRTTESARREAHLALLAELLRGAVPAAESAPAPHRVQAR